MAYKIVITESAIKELKRIPAKMQDRIFEKIEGLVADPKPHGYKKLKNFGLPSRHQEPITGLGWVIIELFIQ